MAAATRKKRRLMKARKVAATILDFFYEMNDGLKLCKTFIDYSSFRAPRMKSFMWSYLNLKEEPFIQDISKSEALNRMLEACNDYTSKNGYLRRYVEEQCGREIKKKIASKVINFAIDSFYLTFLSKIFGVEIKTTREVGGVVAMKFQAIASLHAQFALPRERLGVTYILLRAVDHIAFIQGGFYPVIDRSGQSDYFLESWREIERRLNVNQGSPIRRNPEICVVIPTNFYQTVGIDFNPDCVTRYYLPHIPLPRRSEGVLKCGLKYRFLGDLVEFFCVDSGEFLTSFVKNEYLTIAYGNGNGVMKFKRRELDGDIMEIITGGKVYSEDSSVLILSNGRVSGELESSVLLQITTICYENSFSESAAQKIRDLILRVRDDRDPEENLFVAHASFIIVYERFLSLAETDLSREKGILFKLTIRLLMFGWTVKSIMTHTTSYLLIFLTRWLVWKHLDLSSLCDKLMEWLLSVPDINVLSRLTVNEVSEITFKDSSHTMLVGEHHDVFRILGKFSIQAQTLLDKVMDVNGYTRHMENIDVKKRYFSELFPISKNYEPAGNHIAIANELVLAIDPQFQATRPEYHNQFLDEAELSSVVPLNATLLKFTDHPSGRYRLQRIYLSKIRGGESAVKTTTRVTLNALATRNLGVTHQAYLFDTRGFFYRTLDQFASCCFVDDWRDKVASFRSNPPAIDIRNVKAWCDKMTPEKMNKYVMEDIVALENMDNSQLIMILKGRAKDQLKHTKPSQPQTVFFLPQDQGASALIYFNEIARRIGELWSDKVITGDRKNDRDLERLINVAHHKYDLNYTIPSVQVDISQYDKSEGRGANEVERCFYELVGADKSFLDSWFTLNMNVRARMLSLYFTLDLPEQRRSGHPTTLLGNTLVNMFTQIVLDNIEPDQLVFYWVQGDDGALGLNRPIKTVNANMLRKTMLFNLILKYEEFKHHYGCSRFLLNINGVLRMTYDPVRFFLKLSRNLSEYEYEHLDERFASYKDMTHGYDNLMVREVLIEAMEERYKFDRFEASMMIDVCLQSVMSLDTFRDTWRDQPMRV